MALRRFVGCLPIAVLTVAVWTGCKDKGAAGKPQPDLDARCEQLGKACGDNEKHVSKLVDECKQAAKQQIANGCADKAMAAYDCFEKELCGKADKVWALDDFHVLSERHGKCLSERDASNACPAK